jgi:hypothetical protein
MRDLNELYLEGGAAIETGLLLFDIEWPNVLAGWSGGRELRAEDEKSARLQFYRTV